jgi:hypothetical protein
MLSCMRHPLTPPPAILDAAPPEPTRSIEETARCARLYHPFALLHAHVRLLL